MMIEIIYYFLFLSGLCSLPCLTQGTSGWTVWFDTDTPDGQGDYENVASIRKRGYFICKAKPMMSECRISGNDEIFSDQTFYSNNRLVVPCSDEGLVCINSEQTVSNPCHNFEVRFYCAESNDADGDNANLIGFAAGASVLVPILCVMAVHVYKGMCRKRRPVSDLEEPQTTQERAIENNDAPPSYETLFADGTISAYGSQEALLDMSVTTSNFTNSSRTGHVNNSTTISEESNSSHNRDGDQPNVPSTEGNNSVFHISTSDITVQTINSINNGLRRLPGMHLSLFDFFHHEQQLTPPPSYDEAIIIIQDKSLNKS